MTKQSKKKTIINVQSSKCDKCSVRIPKYLPKLICSLCNKQKHIRCQQLSKKDAQNISSTGYSWTCRECMYSILPINACRLNSVPKFQIQCTSCDGWSYSENSVIVCIWCDNSVHSKCHNENLGCTKCCESMIPGYNVASYDLLHGNYNNINIAGFNPYDRYATINSIGNRLDSDNQLNDNYWAEIGEILTNCKYQEPSHVKPSAPNELKVFSLNVRSLAKNISYFKEEVHEISKYDILCLNETKCNTDKLSNGIDDIIIDGFYDPIVKNPNRKSGKGGGLAIYINKRVCDPNNIENFSVNLDPEDMSGEFQFVKIHNCKGFNRTKVIVNFYRSPNRDTKKFLSLLDNVLRGLDRHSRKHVMFFGDANIDLVRYDTDSNSQSLVDVLARYGFVQTVSKPTRVTDHSATLIDHVYTNDIDNTISCNVLTLDISDHLATLTTVKLGPSSRNNYNRRTLNKSSNKVTETRLINEANHTVFRELIEGEIWEDLSNITGANEKYDKFCDIYMKHYNTA